MDPTRPKAGSIGITDGKIGFVSTDRIPAQSADPRTVVMDCSGKTIVPGFIDAHCHLLAYAKRLTALDVGPRHASCIADVQTLLREAAERIPLGTWITGYGYNEFRLAEKRHLTRWDLDAAVSSHPVRLMHRSGHAQLLNSMGLDRLGITIESGDPPNGMIDREVPSGEPTGLLFGMDKQIARQVSPASGSLLEAGIQAAGCALSAQGITTVYDATERNDHSRLAQVQAWKRQELFPQRVRMGLGWDAFQELQGHPVESSPFAYGVKLVLDGITGAMHPNQDELNKMVLQIHRAGAPVVIHAIEQRHIAAACAAIERARKEYPSIRPRHRIEHCSICPPELASRIADAEITVVTQPAFLYQDGDRYLETVSKDELPYLYPVATLFRSGVCTAGSSDCPIALPNPLLGIYAAVTRRSETHHMVLAQERLSPYNALQMFTINAARAMGVEEELGSIQVGKAANLVVLNGDPTAVPAEALPEIQVQATMIDGEIVWTA